MMETPFESVAENIRKFASVAHGWLSGPDQITLAENDRDRLIGRYRTKAGQDLVVTKTCAGFRIEGLTQWELLPIERATLFTGNDPELIVRFKYLQNGRYTCLVATHPLRLTTIALRV
jgi:hypothetical protein